MPRTARASRFPRGAAVALATLIVLPAPGALGGTEQTISFGYRAGATTWVVPAGVHTATFDLAGARGGIGVFQSQAGRGARVVATIAVTPGETLQINVGGEGGGYLSWPTRTEPGRGKGGWNGGGDGGLGIGDDNGPYQAPGGGGASDVRRDADGDYVLADRILTAGGGGGNSFHIGHTYEPPRGLGGDGGGLQGNDGVVGRSGGSGACYLDKAGSINGVDLGQGGGAESGGGASGATGGIGGQEGDALGDGGANSAGSNGVKGKGGDGGDSFACGGQDGGGGGGGGHYGGGGGGGASLGNGGGGGGGGSSFGPKGAVYTVGHNNASGYVKITFKPGDPPPISRQPDARVRLGPSGAFAGNDIYNTTGAAQSKTGSAARGRTIVFGVSMQNDGSAPQKLSLKATGPAAGAYGVKYLNGSADVTAAVVAGTFRTPTLAPGATHLITVRVTVKPSAPTGSKVVRTLTVASGPSPSQKDVVKVTGKRS